MSHQGALASISSVVLVYIGHKFLFDKVIELLSSSTDGSAILSRCLGKGIVTHP